MKHKRKESPTLHEAADTWRSQSIDLAVAQRRVRARTGRIATPKTSAASMSKEQAQYYKDVANELLWKSKAQARIIANLREALIMAGVEISTRAMDPTYNLSRSTLTKASEGSEDRPWIFVPGVGWTLSKS